MIDAMSDPIRLRLKIVPKASRDSISGWQGEVLKVRVTAAPERGKANRAVMALLASALAVSRRRIQLIAGTSSEYKTVAVEGLSESEARARLARAADRT
jgi:uncharacterized protein